MMALTTRNETALLRRTQHGVRGMLLTDSYIVTRPMVFEPGPAIVGQDAGRTSPSADGPDAAVPCDGVAPAAAELLAGLTGR